MAENKLFNRIESIKIRNISKKYGEIKALENLNLAIEGGELLILIGPSGSGKTTALKTINRLIEPDNGQIKINNHDIMNFEPVKLRRNIGYVIQQIGLFPHLNIRDNISLIPRIEKWDKNRINDRVEELLDLVDLPKIFAKRYPSELSGGQQQRIGLARSIVMDPPLLLMDEPFGALDPILRKQLQIEFLKIRKELGKTIVFVTHDIEEAFKLGDRIAIMDKAKLVQVAKPNELILNPKNDFVSQLVSSHKKFMHMDNLKVKDLMVELSNKYIFESSKNNREVAQKMKKNGIELAVTVSDSKLEGIANFNIICTAKNKDLREVTEKVHTFSPEKCLSEAVAELKEDKNTLAVVVENGRPVGLMLTDKLLLELV